MQVRYVMALATMTWKFLEMNEELLFKVIEGGQEEFVLTESLKQMPSRGNCSVCRVLMRIYHMTIAKKLRIFDEGIWISWRMSNSWKESVLLNRKGAFGSRSVYGMYIIHNADGVKKLNREFEFWLHNWRRAKTRSNNGSLEGAFFSELQISSYVKHWSKSNLSFING